MKRVTCISAGKLKKSDGKKKSRLQRPALLVSKGTFVVFGLKEVVFDMRVDILRIDDIF